MSIQDVYNIGIHEFLNYAAYCKSYIINENNKAEKAKKKFNRR